LSSEQQEGDEGCLSFPDLVYPTPRAFRAVAKGFTMHGEPIVVEGTELLARALQHETDHLDGVLFIDRLSDENRKLAMKEIRDSEWFGMNSHNGFTPTIKVSPHSTGLGI
jgi:peptide deformylase